MRAIYTSTLLFLLILLTQNGYSQTSKYSSQDSIEVHYNFIVAASKGEVNSVNVFINLGVNLDYRDGQGATALFYAVNNGHIEVVKTLLYYGANTNLGTYDGYTPLMAASANGDIDMAQLLLYIKSTKLDLYDNKYGTALNYAAYYGNYFIVDMLLFYGANANILDRNFNSSLYYAALNGDTAIVSRLIKAKTKILHQNKDGISPMHIAIIKNDTVLFDLFYKRINWVDIESSTLEDLVKAAVKFENVYALDSLLKLDNNDLCQNKEITRIAYVTENRKVIKTIKDLNFKKIYTPIFSAFQSNFSTSFNGDDYMCYMSIGVRESRYNLDFNIRYGTRFSQHSIVKQQSKNVYYQLWEKRRIIGVQLRKNFLLSKYNYFTIKPFVAIDFQGHWGKYKGYSEGISPNFYMVPEMGVSFQKDWLVFDLSYQYAKFVLEGVSNSRINLGIGFMIPFYDKPNIDNEIWE